MASNRTMETVAKFTQLGYTLNIVPVKVNWNPYITFNISFNKKYIAATCFSLTVNTALILAFLKDLTLNSESMENEDIVFTFTLVSLLLAILAPQLWAVCNLESIVALVNTFLAFNQHLCEFLQ